MKKAKSRWHTVRCVVEYRTPQNMSDNDLARHVQYLLDVEAPPNLLLNDSRMRAKSFNQVVSRMEGARPARLRSAIRALDAAVARLRKL